MVKEIVLDGERIEKAALAMVVVGAVMIALVLLMIAGALFYALIDMIVQSLTEGSLVEILTIGGLLLGFILVGTGCLAVVVLESTKEDENGT